MVTGSIEFDTALEALEPSRFGFDRFENGWVQSLPDLPSVAYAPLAWPHTQVPSHEYDGSARIDTNALKLVVALQQSTWGFPPEETVPVNVLSILQDTGGAVVVAYDLDKGFNADGWLGFVIGFGTRSGEYYSHMLGVREDLRGSMNLGWYLKVLQAYLAVQTGHHCMTWTFDPMRGANARLNLEKLGSEMVNLTIDKYGVLRSSLYGDVPTDRFTAWWNLLDPNVHKRLHAIQSGQFSPMRIADVVDVPIVRPDNTPLALEESWPVVAYEIPGDIDRLAKSDPDQAVSWRLQMRTVLGLLMTSRRAGFSDAYPGAGPIATSELVEPGPYSITRFASGIDELNNERRNIYVLTRKENL